MLSYGETPSIMVELLNEFLYELLSSISQTVSFHLKPYTQMTLSNNVLTVSSGTSDILLGLYITIDITLPYGLNDNSSSSPRS